MPEKNRRVVVTGLGILSPNAHGIQDFASALKKGTSGIRYYPGLKELNFNCHIAGAPTQDLEALRQQYFTQDVLTVMKSIVISYACITAIDAWKDAGLTLPTNDAAADVETGAIMGIGGVSDLVSQAVHRIEAGEIRKMGSTYTEQIMGSCISARIAGLLALGGHVTTMSNACVTGTEAVIQAFYAIRSGQAERMLASGSDAPGALQWGSFDAMKVLASKYNDQPERGSRPMSASSSGFVPSSGSGALILESLASAEKRGARIYAEVLGGHINAGGHRMGGSMTRPNYVAAETCLRQALHKSGIEGKQIDLINGHLTGTLADPYEVETWQSVLGIEANAFPWIQSTKSMLGHTLGAAGAIECIATVLQLHQSFIHPSLNCEDLHHRLSDFSTSIPSKSFEEDIKIAAKSSFGFGDVNACAIFAKFR